MDFPNCKIWKLNNFKNSIISQIRQLQEFLEYCKLEIFGIFQIKNFFDLPIWKINKFLQFHNLEN